MLEIKDRIGIPDHKTSGVDTIEGCRDKEHFKSYPKDISYRYNSKGFRDYEWPEDLSEVIWCVVDSFTVGIGQPFEETWPYLLGEKTGKRCINLGEDGCSNDTIALRTREIFKLYNPKLVVIMWSYLQRRRIGNKNVHHDRKDFGYPEDITNFVKNYKLVNELPISIINTIIPNTVLLGISKKILKYFLGKKTGINNIDLFEVEQVDWARDFHHFDIKTSQNITDYMLSRAENITPSLTNNLNNTKIIT